jgi:hypothetical protein
MFIVFVAGATEIWTYVLSMVIWGFIGTYSIWLMDLVSKAASASNPQLLV